MKVAEQNALRKRVYDMLGQHDCKFVLEHFLQENISRRTIYSIFKRYNEGLPAQGKRKSGRKPKLNNKQVKKLQEVSKNKIGASVRKLANRFKVSRETIRRNLKKLNLRYYKRKIVPRYTEKQLQEIPKKCRLLRRKFLKPDCVLIMDDEKYFTFSNNNDQTNKGFYTDSLSTTSENVKYSKKSKFEPKVLVWFGGL